MRKPQSALIAGVGLALFFLLLPACGGGNAGGDTDICGEFGTMDGDRCDRVIKRGGTQPLPTVSHVRQTSLFKPISQTPIARLTRVMML